MVVVGRGPTLGRPLSLLLSNKGTDAAVVLPSGVMVPRSYPVASRARCGSGRRSLFTPTTARSFDQLMRRSPGTRAKRYSPS